jgi:hypothetical protein
MPGERYFKTSINSFDNISLSYFSALGFGGAGLGGLLIIDFLELSFTELPVTLDLLFLVESEFVSLILISYTNPI